VSRVLLAYPLADPAAHTWLADRAQVVVARDGADFRALLGSAAAVIVRPPVQLDSEAFTRALHLRVVVNTGSGMDHIDLEAATAAGVQVLSAPGLNARAVAEYVLSVMISGSRRLEVATGYLRDGAPDWAARLHALRGHELGGSTLGVVGFGHVGRQVAALARGLGMRVVTYDPFVEPAAGLVDEHCEILDALLAQSRIVSLHVPLTELTRTMIGSVQLDLLGPDCMLINTSRGAVVDAVAVARALHDGRLWAAALDVYDPEPPDPVLLAALTTVPHLILTPHIAGISHEAGTALAWRAVHDVAAALALGT
jgi:(S)-sulfolactate dehydrogenase